MDEGAWQATVHVVAQSRTKLSDFHTHDIKKKQSTYFRCFDTNLSISCFSHVWLCDPMDYTVYGILQARILEWVAVPFFRGPTQGSNPGLWHCRQILYQLSHQGSPIFIQKNDEQRKGIESEKTGRGEEGNRQQQVRGGRRGEEAISSFLKLREVTKDTSGYKVHPNYLE